MIGIIATMLDPVLFIGAHFDGRCCIPQSAHYLGLAHSCARTYDENLVCPQCDEGPGGKRSKPHQMWRYVVTENRVVMG